MKNAGILTIGNEILQGYTLDSNANTISKELTKRNINVTIHLTVPDKISKIKEKIENAVCGPPGFDSISSSCAKTEDPNRNITKYTKTGIDLKLIFLPLYTLNFY